MTSDREVLERISVLVQGALEIGNEGNRDYLEEIGMILQLAGFGLISPESGWTYTHAATSDKAADEDIAERLKNFQD